MSQKYKSFSRSIGRNSECGTLPPGVKRMGYLRKLKKMKRRFFVLHMESNYGVARLEYYGSEKKWRFGCEPKRCIELKSCLNIGRRLHSKHANVIGLHTRDDSFSLVAENADELELWLNDILEVQKSFMETDENVRGRPIFEHLWQVVIDKHDLEYDKLLAGPYRVALSTKSLYLMKMNPLSEEEYLEFPLMSIRRCGHSKDHFFIELGRSAATGAGEIYMATEATIIAQNMHETVLSAMKSSKTREDANPPQRPRSSSTSDNSSSASLSRRPIGVVAPQTASATSAYQSHISVSASHSSGLSNSRERCDSLPNRPQTIAGCCPYNTNALSSPYVSSGTTSFKRLGSRPHSMYEWPSCNSPSSRNANFSPNCLSSTTGCNSSTEEIDNIRHLSLACSSHPVSANGNLPTDPPISEVPDEYLMMSPGEENKPVVQYSSSKPPSDTIHKNSDYLDMKSNTTCSTESTPKSGGYMMMVPTDASIKSSKVAGYMDMSPSNSLSKSSLGSSASSGTNQLTNIQNISENLNSQESNQVSVSVKSVISQKTTFTAPLQKSNIAPWQNYTTCQSSSNNASLPRSKPPIPGRIYPRYEFKSHTCPRLTVNHSEGSIKVSNVNPVKTDFCQEISTSDDQDVFYSNTVSPEQNTNFSCLSNCERVDLIALPCSPMCSGNRGKNEQQKSSLVFQSECDSLEVDCIKSPVNSEDLSLNREVLTDGAGGDYVNIDIKKPDAKSVPPRKAPLMLPACVNDPSYTNIQFGKPVCPVPNPIPTTTTSVTYAASTIPIDPADDPVVRRLRNVPNTLPAFRKQMSAPAPSSLRPELPSPGRKSSCPVTASASMLKPAIPITTGVRLQHIAAAPHLRVATGRSPDHSSVSSVSSASDEVSSAHSSPKTLTQYIPEGEIDEAQYENVVLPQKSSRPSSVSSERELNYAMLDLAPPVGKDCVLSPPPVVKPAVSDGDEGSAYAEIDFTKSEGLKNTSGTIREGRL